MTSEQPRMSREITLTSDVGFFVGDPLHILDLQHYRMLCEEYRRWVDTPPPRGDAPWQITVGGHTLLLAYVADGTYTIADLVDINDVEIDIDSGWIAIVPCEIAKPEASAQLLPGREMIVRHDEIAMEIKMTVGTLAYLIDYWDSNWEVV